ncbi:hypothetical protein IQ260_03770 [Leptolyngbya cf. ectocarpi LEGE 11479]|uniref:Uncharacterized protein n=1 Tax=Leptolyngbya cf. ectocarpi LEGE 11479 TaxID=1828722 RepID=A0A928X0V0_LEPEC|nr:hypothetical protein [Leptolyngbya ectocarpi]MBE9065766.1 hypothetical protein [Leptolyngbya cf. ectocarpi LEGE 11479]
MNSYKFLRLTEYAAAAASVVGAIATISTQQVAYAAVPLAFSVSLNLISRHQQEKLLEQRFSQTQKEVDQQLQQVQRRLQKLDLSIADVISSAQANSQSLSEQTTQQIQAFSNEISSLQNRLAEQTQELANDTQSLQERLDQQGATSQTGIDQVTEELRQLQASVTEAISSAQERQSLAEQAIQQIQSLSSEIGSLQERLEQQSTTSQAGIDQVTERFRELQVSVTDLTVRSESILDQVTNNLTETREQITREQRTNLELATQSLSSNITQLQNELDGLKLDVDEFRARLETIISPPKADFPHNIIPNLPTADGCDREIVLGIDFGTGFTKVCFWDVGSDQAEIVTFAAYTAEESTLEQALIPTKLAILSDDTLLTGLTMSEWENSTHVVKRSVDFIKMRLADLDMPTTDSWRLEQVPELNEPDTVESICAYYLSQVITRAQAWIEENRPDLFANQTIHWSVNIGVPAAYCDSPALERFHRVLSLAWVFNHSSLGAVELTLPKLQQLSTHIRDWMDTNVNPDSLDCITTPEISAAAWSFLSSPAARDGFYTLFDIGDGTLDGSAFRFWRDGGTRHVDIYKAEVQPLGVTALTKQAADELHRSIESVRHSLNGPHDPELQQQIQKSDSRKNVQKLVASIVVGGNEKHQDARHILTEDDIGKNLSVLIGGGGSNTSFFQDTIESTHGDFRHESMGIPPYQLKKIPVPDKLATNGLEPKEFGRFTVAYGLCILPYEETELIRLPSQVEKDEAPIRVKYFRRESYENTRDMT